MLSNWNINWKVLRIVLLKIIKLKIKGKVNLIILIQIIIIEV